MPIRCFAVLGALALAACGSSTEPKGPPAQLTALPRELSADEIRVSRAANQFAFTLFRRLNEAQPNDNVFVSPLSVTFSLGMTMNGAAGTTLDEMRSTLGFGTEELNAINAGYRDLMSLESGLDPSTTFQIANSVWYRQTFPFHQAFMDTVKKTFDAEVRGAPFDQSTVTQVNDWVSAKTNDKIQTILDGIAPDHVMFLIDAIYFKGSWREQFDPAKTRDAPFAALDGTQQVKTMRRADGTGKIRYGGTATATVGELSYGNGAFVMTIVMPHTGAGGGGDVNAFAATLDTTAWTSLVAPMAEADYAVSLPKFRLSYERELKDDLIALGMRVPFVEGGADFTRMSPAGRDLFIAFVKHKTFVDVNEEGTEAAAVTNTGVGFDSAPPCLCVDRPFIFAIRERFSGTILFIGKIVRIP
ncbi:MAG: serpin family protein [Gemmatimonadaceae bacterium]